MRENETKILLIEDEKGISNFICSSLEMEGYTVLSAESGMAGLALIEAEKPDILLLDLGLPDMDGLDIIRKIRRTDELRIIVISARDREMDKVQALDLGADDYLTKPFGISELKARLRTALRHMDRKRDKKTDTEVFKIRDLTIDPVRHIVKQGDREIHFTQNEYKSFVVLARNCGKVLTYDYLTRQIWGPYSGKSERQILRVNMVSIRRKLGEDPANPKYIMNEFGIGYRFMEEDGESEE